MSAIHARSLFGALLSSSTHYSHVRYDTLKEALAMLLKSISFILRMHCRAHRFRWFSHLRQCTAALFGAPISKQHTSHRQNRKYTDFLKNPVPELELQTEECFELFVCLMHSQMLVTCGTKLCIISSLMNCTWFMPKQILSEYCSLCNGRRLVSVDRNLTTQFAQTTIF